MLAVSFIEQIFQRETETEAFVHFESHSKVKSCPTGGSLRVDAGILPISFAQAVLQKGITQVGFEP